MSDLNEGDFEALEDKVGRLGKAEAAAPTQRPADPHHQADPAHDEQDFEDLVSTALDELPADVIAQLKDVAVVVSDEGAKYGAYGMYRGRNVAAKGAYVDFWGGTTDQILIFRDTLVRDYGRDLASLTTQVRTTVRHEVGHYLGMDEDEVRRLGL